MQKNAEKSQLIQRNSIKSKPIKKSDNRRQKRAVDTTRGKDAARVGGARGRWEESARMRSISAEQSTRPLHNNHTLTHSHTHTPTHPECVMAAESRPDELASALFLSQRSQSIGLYALSRLC